MVIIPTLRMLRIKIASSKIDIARLCIQTGREKERKKEIEKDYLMYLRLALKSL